MLAIPCLLLRLLYPLFSRLSHAKSLIFSLPFCPISLFLDVLLSAALSVSISLPPFHVYQSNCHCTQLCNGPQSNVILFPQAIGPH